MLRVLRMFPFSQAAIKLQLHGGALRRGVGGDRRLRLFSLPFGRLRRGETPACGKDPLWLERPAGRSRPSGATMCKWWIEQLGGASADAQSYWQGRFAACTFVERVWHTGRPRNSWGVAPNPSRDAVPAPCKGHCPLTRFGLPGLGALPLLLFSLGFYFLTEPNRNRVRVGI